MHSEYNLNSLPEALPDMAKTTSVTSSSSLSVEISSSYTAPIYSSEPSLSSLVHLVPLFWNVFHPSTTTNTPFYSRLTPFYLSRLKCLLLKEAFPDHPV